MECDICCEGDLSLRCEFTDFLLNLEEHYLWNEDRVVTEVPLYFYVCNVCGLEQGDETTLSVNRMVAKQARWEWNNEAID